MDYELAKKLKDAGFPQEGKGHFEGQYIQDIQGAGTLNLYIPTLEELIEACNPEKADDFGIVLSGDVWEAYYIYVGHFNHSMKFKTPDDLFEVNVVVTGPTPLIAVANLYLALKSK